MFRVLGSLCPDLKLVYRILHHISELEMMQFTQEATGKEKDNLLNHVMVCLMNGKLSLQNI